MLKVLLCDDQELLAEGLKLILESDAEIRVVGIAPDGAVGVEMTRELRPDVILMDLKMPIMNGAQATEIIREEFPEIHVLMLTTFNDEDWVMDAVRSGAAGYILKDASRERLIAAVKDVAAGKNPIDPGVAGTLMRQVKQPARPTNSTLTDNLTERELEVLQLVAQGMSNAKIGEKLFLSEGTIRNYITNILVKLGASDRTQAAVLALRYGLID